MADCPHGYDKPASCLDCMYEGNLPVTRPPKATVVSRFTAAYTGHCRTCNSDIMPGEKIAKMSDDSYVHEDCA